MISKEIQIKLIGIILKEESIDFDTFEGQVWIMSRSLFGYNINWKKGEVGGEISGYKPRKVIRKDLIKEILIYT
jgi:hypothetical protein